MTREEIIAAVKECAKGLGRPPKFAEFYNFFPVLKLGAIQKKFGAYTQLLVDSGFQVANVGTSVPMDKLFRDWVRIVRKLGKTPTYQDYPLHSEYSVRPLLGRFKKWSQVPRGLYKYAKEAKLESEFADVMEMIKQHYCGEPESAWIFEKETEITPGNTFAFPDRPTYGPPLSPVHMACGPTNESGVIFLFGMIAGQLGFVVTRIQTAFPDCEAWRQVGEERWQPVKIEFEYESYNFLKHFHNADDCDLIVCWKHNWPDCPLEVVELKAEVGRLGTRAYELGK